MATGQQAKGSFTTSENKMKITPEYYAQQMKSFLEDAKIASDHFALQFKKDSEGLYQMEDRDQHLCYMEQAVIRARQIAIAEDIQNIIIATKGTGEKKLV